MAKDKLISELTPAQEALLPEYRERFRDIGLDTSPTNKEKAEAAIRRSYEYLSKNGPEVANPEIIWADSPQKGAILAAQHAKGSLNVTEKEIHAQAPLASFGSFEAYWVSVYVYITEQLPVEKDELSEIALDIVTNCGAYWTFEDLVILTPKPTNISMLDTKLHNATGPAIVYPNGDNIYALNGVLKNSLMEVMIAGRLGNTEAGEDGDEGN